MKERLKVIFSFLKRRVVNPPGFVIERKGASWLTRMVAFGLIPVQLLTLPPVLWAAAAADLPATTPTPIIEKRPVQTPGKPANRRLPELNGGAAISQKLSAKPTEQEISAAGVFEEPLTPIGKPANETDNQSIARWIAQWQARVNQEDFSLIDTYVQENPGSAWSASLLANKGNVCRRLGYFSQALTAWQQAWEFGKNETSLNGKAIMDRTAGELAELNARLGRYEWLEPFFASIEGRNIQGSATEKILGARQGLWLMKNKPENAFRCGPMALDRIRAHSNPALAFDVQIRESRSTLNGLSLAAVEKLAANLDMDYVVARRDSNASFVGLLPAVVHWKVGHYAALISSLDGRFRVEDPTFGGVMSISQAAIDAESSGYFLVPRPKNGEFPQGWHAVDAQEAGQIWGKGNTGQNDPKRLSCRDEKVRNICNNCRGMADYDVFAMLVSLQISDNPVGYTPARGPAMNFVARYNQRESSQPPVFTYSNLGPKWTFDWFSYVQYDDLDPQQPPEVYLLGGGSENYPDLVFVPSPPPAQTSIADVTYGYDYSVNPPYAYVATANYQPQQESRAKLQKVDRHKFIRTFPDGRKEIYDHLATASAILSPRKLLLTKMITALGEEVTLSYDSSHRLQAITDVLGNVSTLHYDLGSDPLKITSVEDPYGRTAYFEYNNLGRLVKITDVLGLTSEFTYGINDFVDSLTTGYGTTTFSTGGSGTTRWIEVTDPQGDKERTEFRDDAPGIISAEVASNVPVGIPVNNQWLAARNSFYWNKAAYKVATAAGGLDYTKAKLYHWLHAVDTNVCAGVLESTKEPYENRVWRHYQNQVWAGGMDPNMLTVPDKVARVVDGGATQLFQYENNWQGRPTKVIDPLGRETRFSYAANDLDVTEIRQRRTGGGTDLVGSFTYNAARQIETATDGAGLITNYEYDGLNRLKKVEDPLGNETTLEYNGDGFLKKINGWQAGASAQMEYDGYGRLSKTTNSDGYEVQTEYDELDRPTRVNYPDGSHEEVTYNLLNVEWSRDRIGRWTRSYFNALGQVVGSLSPSYEFTGYDWCKCGALKSITDALGRSTVWHHDVQGRVTSKDFPDGSVESYDYEPLSGRLKKITDALGQQTVYTYLGDDRVGSVAQTSPIGRAAVNVSYTYDPDYARVATIVDSEGTTQYGYVASGTLGAGKVAYVDGPWGSDTIVFTYDELGRPTNQAIHGVNATVHYDAYGRVDSTTNALGTFNSIYDGTSNRLTRTTFPNGQKTEIDYLSNDGDRQISSITNTAPGGALLSSNSYTYRETSGPISNWGRQRGSATATSLQVKYDRSDRFADATLRNASTQAQLQHFAYRFDAADNRTGEQIDNLVATEAPNQLNQPVVRAAGGKLKVRGAVDEAATVTVNGVSAQVDSDHKFEGEAKVEAGANAFTVVATDGNGNAKTQNYSIIVPAVEPRQLEYDAVGNLTSETRGTATRTYEWDAADRMTAINFGTHRTEFGYNGRGQRIRITEKESGVVTSDRRFLWNGMTLCEERDATGVNVTKHYVGGGEKRIGGPEAGNYYYASDHLGNVCELTDSTGAVRARYEYSPYGARTKTGGDLDTERGFTGHFLHAATGLYLTPTRLYDSGIGRWLSRDPLAEGGGLNLYAYVGGDPINLVDPSGMSAAGIALGVGVGIGAAMAMGAFLASMPFSVPALLTTAIVGAFSAWAGNAAEQLYDKGFCCYNAREGLDAAVVGGLTGGVLHYVGPWAGTIARGLSRSSASKSAAGVADRLSASVKSSFTGGKFSAWIADVDTVMYRAENYGQGAGRFFGLEKPINSVEAEIMYNIKMWGNDATELASYLIPAGTKGFIGSVEGGSGIQVFIPNTSGVKLVERVSLFISELKFISR